MPELDAERRERLAEAVCTTPGCGHTHARRVDALAPLIAGWLAEAWQEGAFYYGGDAAEQWYFNDGGSGHNPYRAGEGA